MKARDEEGLIWVDRNPHAAPAPGIRLIDWLRDSVGCLSVKEGCGAGQCGACTVLVDDVPVLACCVLAAGVRGRTITTARGLAQDEAGARLARNLARYGGVQCGFCSPGMLVACFAWLTNDDRLSGDAGTSLRRALAGNICRCTGYDQIMESALAAAAEATTASTGTAAHGGDHDEP
jgi:carbon-monoxide dehydrogenase small subunit